MSRSPAHQLISAARGRLEEPFALDRVQEGEGDAQGKRPSAEGRSVRPGAEIRGEILATEEGAERQAGAKGLARVTRSGVTPPGGRPTRRRPAEPALHLVGDEQGPAASHASRAARSTPGSSGRRLPPPAPARGSRRRSPGRPPGGAPPGRRAGRTSRRRREGRTGRGYFSWPVAERARAVRPWNEPSSATIRSPSLL